MPARFPGGATTLFTKIYSFCYISPDPLHKIQSLDGPSTSQTFCYISPDPLHKIQSLDGPSTSQTTTVYRTISGASISANTYTPLSTACTAASDSIDKASAFESSNFFSSIPLGMSLLAAKICSGRWGKQGRIGDGGWRLRREWVSVGERRLPNSIPQSHRLRCTLRFSTIHI